MLEDLSDAVLDCSAPIVVTRYEEPTIVNGRKTAQPECCKLSIMASVSPLPSKEMERLPEGTKAKGAKLVISPERMYTVQVDENRPADEIHYGGVDYIVHSVSEWFELGGFYAYVAARLDR